MKSHEILTKTEWDIRSSLVKIGIYKKLPFSMTNRQIEKLIVRKTQGHMVKLLINN